MTASRELSVVVCTHNPRSEYLRRTLNALREQSLPRERWELIVVDNMSSTPVATNHSIDWHPFGRILVEPSLGLTPARLRGIVEAAGETLVFVDDDNVLDPNYLEEVVKIAADFPFLGAWGGQMRPEFETPPAAWTREYWPMLALSELERDLWSNKIDDLSTTPCGAGLCIRHPIALRYVEACRTSPIRTQLDRKGTSLASCGDSDMALTACDVGLGTGRFQRLKLTHLIPSARLTLPYLTKLVEEMTFSSYVLQMIRSRPLPHLTPLTPVARLFSAYARLRATKERRAILDARQRAVERARLLNRTGSARDGQDVGGVPHQAADRSV